MGIVALARQESRAKAVDMTLWVRQSLAQRQPVGPCPKLAIPLGFAGPNFWPAPPTAGQRGRHAKICKTQRGWGTSRNRLGLRGPQPPRGHAPAIYIAVSPTPIIRAATSGLSPSCTRHTRFQGRMIQIAGVIFSHAPSDSRATAHVEKTVRSFMNGLIAWRLRQTMQKSRNHKSRFDF
jgi:hypothetical protein